MEERRCNSDVIVRDKCNPNFMTVSDGPISPSRSPRGTLDLNPFLGVDEIINVTYGITRKSILVWDVTPHSSNLLHKCSPAGANESPITAPCPPFSLIRRSCLLNLGRRTSSASWTHPRIISLKQVWRFETRTWRRAPFLAFWVLLVCFRPGLYISIFIPRSQSVHHLL